MDNQYSSFYLYRKYEVIGDELIDLGITSIDAEGTLEPVMKEECDPECGCPPPEPIYRWVQTEDTVCVGEEPSSPKFIFRKTDATVASAECDSSSAITSSEVSSYNYGYASLEIGECVASIGDWAFAFFAQSSVTISDSVTTIGSYAFFNSTYITSVTIGNSVATIGAYAFGSLQHITGFTIPSSVTNIGNNAFSQSDDITSITCLATTPPTLGSGVFDNTNNCPIYVPCASLSAYQSAWSAYASRIECIPKEKIILFEGSQSFAGFNTARFSKSEGFLQVYFEHNVNGYLDYLYINNEPLYVEFSSVPDSGTVTIQNGWWSTTFDPAAPVSTSEPLEIYITDNAMYNDIYQYDLALYADTASNGFTITSVYFYK